MPAQANIDAIDKPLPPDGIDRTPKYTPINKVFDLIAVKGLSYHQASKILNISVEAVRQLCIRNDIPSKNGLKRIRKNRAEALMALQDRILSSIDGADIKKASLLQKMSAVGIAYDKERLERGESTQNVSVAHIEALKTLDEVDAELAKITGDTDGSCSEVPESKELKEIEAEIARIKGE
jgi:hypothetical protein